FEKLFLKSIFLFFIRGNTRRQRGWKGRRGGRSGSLPGTCKGDANFFSDLFERRDLGRLFLSKVFERLRSPRATRAVQLIDRVAQFLFEFGFLFFKRRDQGSELFRQIIGKANPRGLGKKVNERAIVWGFVGRCGLESL